MTTTVYAGRFDFEDGGTYCGGWEDGKAHGHGVCTGPKSMGEFSGMWQFGYEVSGVYIWPSGNCYQGQWMSGKRHGLGVEKKQRWIYKGEWSQGFKGRYGVRISETSGAKYEGTWANGLQDGYGSETYADAGTYFGQMSQGMRNGYGIRKSVSYGVASRYRSKDVKDSLTSLRSEDGDEKTQRERDRRFDENRGGFVLRAKSDISEDLNAVANATSNVYMPNSGNIMTNTLNSLLRRRRNSLNQSQDRRVSLRKTIISKLKKQKSVGDIDEVNTVGGGAHTSNLHTTSSSGRTNKKSSFRSTSSNNSVDSRTSNRTAPPGLGLNTLGSHHMASAGGNANQQDDGEHSFISQDEITDVNCIEVYMGEWKQDKRTGFGIAERSDGLKYEGEWFNNKKNGYGVTTFKDGTKEEGKYRNNVLATDKKKTAKLLTLRSNKIRQKIDAAVNAALKAGQIAQQRADIALARAVNARTKANAAEMAAKQSRGDSEFARIRAREVAPDFIQPGELKRIPEIVLDIDRMNGFGPPSQQLQSSIGDPVAFNNISPDQYRKLQQPLNVQLKPDPYMNDPYMSWQQQQQSNYTPHSSTPPPPGPMMRHQTPTRNFNTLTNPSTASYYDPITQQQTLLHHQHSMDFPNSTNNNYLSSNQLMMQHQHPSIDSSSTGPLQQQQQPPKINNDNLSGLNQLDAQTMAQMQMNPNFMQQQQAAFNNKQHLLQQQQNYSFDEQLTGNYYDNSMNYRMSLLQQAQSHSFNMDMLSGAGGPTGLSPMEMQQYSFQRINPKRNTLRRTQRVIDSSTDDLNNNMVGDFNSLSPQQQQQLLMMRNQHYSNNSSGQESGIGTGSSVYTNMTSNVHGNLDMNNPNGQQIPPSQQQQQQQQQQPHLHHHHHSHHPNNLINQAAGGHPSSHHPNGRPQLVSGKSMDASAGQRLDPDFMKIPIQLPRRKSLPSIVKMKSYKEDETAHSSSELNDKNQETFIIENGIRKRVTEKSNSAMAQNKLTGADDALKHPQGNAQQGTRENINTDGYGMSGDDDGGNNLKLRRPYEYDDDEMPQLPRKIIIESITTLNSPDSAITGSKRVSMPSIPAYFSPKLASKVMSREEANRLSSQRREEIRKNRELESNKMLRLKNILKDVFLRNRLFLFIILFNISLAIWFLQMLK